MEKIETYWDKNTSIDQYHPGSQVGILKPMEDTSLT